MPDFSTLTPHKTGYSPNIDLKVVSQNQLNGFLWQGYINIPVSGAYTFKTKSDDGSALWFNSYTQTGQRLVDNDGKHDGNVIKAATIKINAGIYPICIEYFHNNASGSMSVLWSCKELFGDNLTRQIADSFFYQVANITGLPAKPTNISTTAKSYNQIKISWQDNSSNETGFKVYRLVLTSGNYKIVGTVNANTTSFIDSALQPSRKYYYKVQAINLNGNSGLSVTDSATTLALPNAPGAPSNFKATALSPSQIKLTWNNVTNATGYRLMRSVRNTSNIFY